MQKFAHCPRRGETINLRDFRVRVLRADNRHIELMRFSRLDRDNR